MTRNSVPPIDPNDLSDQADAERIERIWQRLEPEIHADHRVVETKAPSRHLWLIAAAFAGVFGVGVWVGHARDGSESTKTALPTRAPENAPTLYATGSMSQTFGLENGGKLLLQADSTVEVGQTNDDAGMILRLVHGSASIDATHAVGGPISIVAGDARLTAPAGGSVAVTRHERDMDVVVSSGTVELESPDGRRGLSVGQSLHGVPILAPVASRSDITPRPSPDFVRRPSPEQKEARNDVPEPRATSQPLETPPATPPVASWTTKVDRGDYKEAANLLGGASGIEAAIRSTKSPYELALLSDLAKKLGKMDLYATAARRLVEEFPADQHSLPLAFDLSNYYRDDAKNPKLADKYNALAQQGPLREDAICGYLKTHGQSPELTEAAKEYERSYPQGFCKATADQILSEAKSDEPKKDDGKDEPKKDDGKEAKDAKDASKDAPKEGAKTDPATPPAPSASAAAKAGPPPARQPAPKASSSAKD